MKIEGASVYERKSSGKFGLEVFSHNYILKYLEINSVQPQPEKDNSPTNAHPQPLGRRRDRNSLTLFTSTRIQLGQPNRESLILIVKQIQWSYQHQ